MKKVISTEKIPIKLWLDDIEDGALDQAKNLANLPFAFKHIAIMPDSHQGYGMPIGGVLATTYMIIPNAVGVDIGCGMCAVKTTATDIDKETLKKIMGDIRKEIPVGVNRHKETQADILMPKIELQDPHPRETMPIVFQEYANAKYSLGTLGGGNHFIEIQKGSDGYIWIMIHSGSRNLGYRVANYYDKLAIDLNAEWCTSVPKSHELAFLPMESKEGRAYIKEMNYCVDFALANRKLMMSIIQEIIYKHTGAMNAPGEYTKDMRGSFINVVHNYARMENHFGKNVMVHRKGATLATKDAIGIIPGSQGTPSYIVKGLGNRDSFNSCSHGAGRKMGRKDAQRNLDLEKEVNFLNAKGIIHSIRNVKDLDEAPGSYKDIDEVIKNQEDLVKVMIKLEPLAVIKG